MALVRLSNQLRDEIISRAGRAFDLRLKVLVDAMPLLKYGDKMYAKAFEDYIPMFAGIPKPFLRWSDGITVHSVLVRGEHGHMIDLGTRDNSPTGHTIQMSTGRPFPEGGWETITPLTSKFARDNRGHRAMSYVAHLGDPDDAQLVTALTEWRSKINATVEQRITYVDGVKQLVKGYGSLAPAIKAWPLLWELLPLHVQEKHKEITSKRGAADKDAPSVDVDRLTSIATVNKLVKQ